MLTYTVKVERGEPAPPLLANAWLAAWEKVQGGVTIRGDGDLEAWMLAYVSDASAQTLALITQLVETPGLPHAVRIVLRSGALQKGAVQ